MNDCGSSASCTATTLIILHYLSRLGVKNARLFTSTCQSVNNSGYSPQSDSARRRSPPYPSRTLKVGKPERKARPVLKGGRCVDAAGFRRAHAVFSLNFIAFVYGEDAEEPQWLKYEQIKLISCCVADHPLPLTMTRSQTVSTSENYTV